MIFKITLILIIQMFIVIAYANNSSNEELPSEYKEMIYLTIDNFKKIKNYIIVEGDLRPWSNLYGDGTLFEFNNIRVIYFPAQIMDNPIAHSWNEFLLIDHKKYKLSFHIENDNNKILVTNDSEYYYGNKMDLDKSNKEANIIFSNILKLVK